MALPFSPNPLHDAGAGIRTCALQTSCVLLLNCIVPLLIIPVLHCAPVNREFWIVFMSACSASQRAASSSTSFCSLCWYMSFTNFLQDNRTPLPRVLGKPSGHVLLRTPSCSTNQPTDSSVAECDLPPACFLPKFAASSDSVSRRARLIVSGEAFRSSNKCVSFPDSDIIGDLVVL
jgi:hypothetical protein